MGEIKERKLDGLDEGLRSIKDSSLAADLAPGGKVLIVKT